MITCSVWLIRRSYVRYLMALLAVLVVLQGASAEPVGQVRKKAPKAGSVPVTIIVVSPQVKVASVTLATRGGNLTAPVKNGRAYFPAVKSGTWLVAVTAKGYLLGLDKPRLRVGKKPVRHRVRVNSVAIVDCFGPAGASRACRFSYVKPSQHTAQYEYPPQFYRLV